MRRPVLRFAALVGVVLAAPACADRAAPAGPGLTVVSEFATYAESTYEHPAGLVEIRLTNDSEIAHTLLIEDADGVDQGVKLLVTSEEPEAVVQVDLEPGTYQFFCDIIGHRLAGMEATVVID